MSERYIIVEREEIDGPVRIGHAPYPAGGIIEWLEVRENPEGRPGPARHWSAVIPASKRSLNRPLKRWWR